MSNAALERVLGNLERNAAAFRAESARLTTENAAGSATASNDVVTVTVDGSGELVAAQFSGMPTDPGRWRQAIASAYADALAQRTPATVSDTVPGLPPAPQPLGPLAPQQHEAEARIAAIVSQSAQWATTADETTGTATVDGVTVTVNPLRLIVDASITPTRLAAETPPDDAVLAAYRQALAELDGAIDRQMGGLR